MALAPSPGTTSPTTASHGPGVYLVLYTNGDAGVVEWDGHEWKWGSVNAPPASEISDVIWLGPKFSSLLNLPSSIFAEAMGALSVQQQSTFIHLTDAAHNTQPGTNQYGQPVLIPGTIMPGGNAPGMVSGSDATSAGINIPGLSGIGGAIQAIANILTGLFSVGLWKGIGLILAGVGLLVFAGIELKKAV